MATRPRDIQIPERDLEIHNRPAAAETLEPGEARLLELGAALAVLKAQGPQPGDDKRPHCFDCFQRGYRAALVRIELELFRGPQG